LVVVGAGLDILGGALELVVTEADVFRESSPLSPKMAASASSTIRTPPVIAQSFLPHFVPEFFPMVSSMSVAGTGGIGGGGGGRSDMVRH
jgi:hypothetical protein